MIEAAGSIQLWSMDPSVWSRLAAACTALHATHMAALNPPKRGMQPWSTPRVAPTRRPVVKVRLTTDSTWLVSCAHCTNWAYVATCRSDADDHARWHRQAHRTAARAER